MNNQSKKYGFFQSFNEMQKTFERLNLSSDSQLKMVKNECKFPKINHTSLIARQGKPISQNIDDSIPELMLRRKWKSDQPCVFNTPTNASKSPAVYATYMREIKLSAQIARVSGRYPRTLVPKPPRFKIILPSQRKENKTTN